ncbi:MAG: M14 family metallocarboxypeptidase [Clostridia bacterium]|nr:M14 family metallocarboxypeptidase [Clostridia bacterium]
MDLTWQETLTRAQPTDHGTVRGLCTALCARYPFLRAAAVGHSVLGRELTTLTLIPPDGQPTAQRVLLAAAFHGQEWITALCALRLCEEVCLAIKSGLSVCGVAVGRALRGRQIVFFPMVNPDGVQIALHGSASAGDRADFVRAHGGDTHGVWQANARGVDINHNFNAGWEEMQVLAAKNGKDQPGARQYSGQSPESEPETRAVTDLCRRLPFRHVVALHSQGEEIYWQYGDATPPQSRMIARVLGAASGYTVTDPVGMASHGGFKDWFISCFHRPGFTIELGRGVNPLPLDEFEEIYSKAREMLLLSLLL